MNKTNLPNFLSALCVVLIAVMLFNQRQQAKQIESLMSPHVLEQRTELEKQFHEMRRQLENLVSSGALFPDKSKQAGEAVALAKAAAKRGNIPLAKIYYLSAVNHAPSEFPLLKEYAELVLRDPAATSDALDRLKSVLQISLYQIPPAFITNAVGLLDKTMLRERELLPPLPAPVLVNWPVRFQQFTKTNLLEKEWAELKLISQRLDGLNEIVESLREEQPGSALTKSAEDELELTQRTLSAASLIALLDRIMNALTLSTNQPEKAVSLLQTAEATLGQLWGIESAGWPVAMRAKIDEYPKEIQRRVEIVAEVKSQPFAQRVTEALQNAQKLTGLMQQLAGFREVNGLLRLRAVTKEFDAKGITIKTNSLSVQNMPIPMVKAGAYQRVCLHYSIALQSAETGRLGISSVAGREKAEREVESIRLLFVEAKRRQFDAYQKWAVELCATSFRRWQDQGFTVNSSILRSLFGGSQLDQIDQSLLTPETAHLFNDVLGKLLKMNGGDQFQTQMELATTPKKKLEEF